MTTTLIAPIPYHRYLAPTSGNAYTSTPNYYVTVATTDVPDLLAQGCTTVPVATRQRQIVGTRTGVNGSGFQPNATYAGVESRIRHVLPFGALDLQLLYAGFKVQSATETAVSLGGGYQAATAVIVAGGSGYAVGDTVVPTVAANQIAPTLVVTNVTSGAITQVAVVEGGMFNVAPLAALAQTSTSGGGTGATFTLTCLPYVSVIRAGIEQVWNTQTAYSTSALTGVLKCLKGANQQGVEGNIPVPSGDFTATESVQVNLPSGSVIGSRMWTNGYNMPSQRGLSGSDGSPALNEYSFYSLPTSANAGDAWGGTFGTNITQYLNSGFQPLAIMGTLATPVPSFVLIGDSIVQGVNSVSGGGNSNDAFDANGNIGWLEKSINAQMPWTSFGSTGDGLTISNWLQQTNNLRLRAIASMQPSHIVDELCVNDFAAGVTFAQMQAYKQAFWKRLIGLGVKEIWCPTCTPKSTANNKKVISLPTIQAGGTGYAASSTFSVTLAGGTGTSAVISVSTNGSGVVTTVNSISNAGLYTVSPASPNTPTGGTGSGLQLNVNFDGWYDTANQTTGAANAAIQAWNTWLRAGSAAAYGVTHILDLGTDVESSVGSGLWAPAATYDGTHPSAATHTLIASHQAAVFATASL